MRPAVEEAQRRCATSDRLSSPGPKVRLTPRASQPKSKLRLTKDPVEIDERE